MARSFGKDIRVYLGSRDVSGDLTTITINAMADTEDSTTFNNLGAHGFDAGLYGWEADVAGFYDGAAAGFGRQLETLLGAAGGVISVYDDLADAIGDKGILLSDGILSKRNQPIQVASLIKLTGSFKAAGNSARPGLYGVLLQPLALKSATSAAASFDSGASSANGGRANFHVTAVTGTGGAIAISDSPDNVTFTDRCLLVGVVATGGYTVEMTGTVQRYLKADWTINGASSLTFVAGFARY